jgi:hypothetical protein
LLAEITQHCQQGAQRLAEDVLALRQFFHLLFEDLPGAPTLAQHNANVRMPTSWARDPRI